MSRRQRWSALVLAGALAVAPLGCSGDGDDGTRRSVDDRGGDLTGDDEEPATTTAAPSTDLVDAACATRPTVAPRPVLATTSDDLTEVSGIAVVPGTTGPSWVHNDSGDRPQVFAVAADGTSTAHDVPGAEAVDWEDIAAGPDGRLYVGDIGDNGLDRPTVTVYRFAPPDPASTAPVAEVARLTLTYSDGPHNAEALMIDPIDERLVVVVKGNGTAGVFVAPLAFDDGDQATLERVGRVDTGVETQAGQVTGGDISPDGGTVALRTYGGALVFRRPPDGPIEAAFDGDACPLPTGAETQGEAIGFDGTSTGYLTIGEGRRPTIASFAPAG